MVRKMQLGCLAGDREVALSAHGHSALLIVELNLVFIVKTSGRYKTVLSLSCLLCCECKSVFTDRKDVLHFITSAFGRGYSDEQRPIRNQTLF